jgi:hypothetical protein
MGKVIWYSVAALLVCLLIWTAFASLRGDFDQPGRAQLRNIRTF